MLSWLRAKDTKITRRLGPSVFTSAMWRSSGPCWATWRGRTEPVGKRRSGEGKLLWCHSDTEVTQHITDVPHECDEGWVLLLEVLDCDREALAEGDRGFQVPRSLAVSEKACDLRPDSSKDILSFFVEGLHLSQLTMQNLQVFLQCFRVLHHHGLSLELVRTPPKEPYFAPPRPASSRGASAWWDQLLPAAADWATVEPLQEAHCENP